MTKILANVLHEAQVKVGTHYHANWKLFQRYFQIQEFIQPNQSVSHVSAGFAYCILETIETTIEK